MKRDRAVHPARGDTLAFATASRYGLPPDLIERTVTRLGWVGVLYAVAWVALHLLHRWASRGTPFEQHLSYQAAITALAALLGLAVSFMTRAGGIAPALKLDLGLLFQVLGALLISLAETIAPFSSEYAIRGHSAIAMWIVFFVLVVPASLGKAILSALMTACMGPLGLAINISVQGVPAPTLAQWLTFYFSSFLMAVMAVTLSRYIYHMGASLSHQKALGSYELVDLLGKGGMGEVWRARHRLLVREAAIKLIRPEVLVGDTPGSAFEARKRFEREARATASLQSPYTVAVHDYGVAEDGSFYYVMELLDGLDLERLVERFGPLAAPRVVHILRQACDSLAEAHELGLTHRDIKPRNIFLCRLGVNCDCVKVLDFGLVKIKDSRDSRLTRAGFTTGTPAYMAPEVALGHHDVDARADIYALGCVAYWLLTEHLVFESTTALGVALEHVKTKPVPPSERTELDVPPGLDSIVMQCLEKDPAHRPGSARELKRMLERVSCQEPWTNEEAEEWWKLHLPAPERTRVEITATP